MLLHTLRDLEWSADLKFSECEFAVYTHFLRVHVSSESVLFMFLHLKSLLRKSILTITCKVFLVEVLVDYSVAACWSAMTAVKSRQKAP